MFNLDYKLPEVKCISTGYWLVNEARAIRQPDMSWYHLGVNYPKLSDVIGMWIKEINND